MWTAAAAVLAAFGTQQTSDESGLLRATGAFLYPVFGVSLCVTAEGLVRRVKYSETFPLEPGEGLAIVVAFSALSYLLTQIVLVLATLNQGLMAVRQTALALIAVMIGGPSIVFCIWFGRRFVLQGAWRRLFYLRALGGAWLIIAHFAMPALYRLGNGFAPYVTAQIAITALLVTAFCAAQFGDWSTPAARRWTHWVGSAAWLALALLSTLTLLWWYWLYE